MTGSTIFCVIIMIAALIGMIVCAKKQKTNPKAQPMAIALLFVVIITGICTLFKGNSNAGMIESENRFYVSKAYVIGKFIVKNFPKAKVLLIENEGFEKNKRVQGFIEALKEGMGNNNVKAVALELLNKPKRPEGMPADMPMMPVMELMTSQDFDATINANSSCNVIISLVGLPRDAKKMQLWRMPNATRPKLILVNSGVGGAIRLDAAIERGMISAVIGNSPTAKYDGKRAPYDLEDAFKKRYILIDKSNVGKNLKLLKF